MTAPVWVPLVLLAIASAEIDRADVGPWYPYIAAQIQAESAWKKDAVSHAGAKGLAQFMPLTWNEVSAQTKPSCKDESPFDPACSTRAQIKYLKSLWSSNTCQSFVDSTDKWRCVWRAYNGGLTWVRRMQRKCRAIFGCNPTRWNQGLDQIKLRSASNDRENTLYPGRILKAIPGYVKPSQ